MKGHGERIRERTGCVISRLGRLLGATFFVAGVFGVQGAAETVALFGEPLTRAIELRQELTAAGFTVEIVDEQTLKRIDERPVDLLVVGPEKQCPADARPAIARLLRRRGNVFVVGAGAFDYSPRPIRRTPVVDLTDPAAYTIAQPKLRGPNERFAVEPVRVTPCVTPEQRPALQFRTYVRGMNDTTLVFPVSAAQRSARRSVLTFWAEGDAYADIVGIEAVDTAGQRWLTFVPLAAAWRSYAVSFADFLPRGGKKLDIATAQLDPAQIASLAIGIEAATVWREKPMAYSLGDIALAEEESDAYAMSGRLAALRVPYREAGMEVPAWCFNPFEGTERIEALPEGVSAAWKCPPPLVPHPGVQMGTDTKAEFNPRGEREQRRVALLRGLRGDVVCEQRWLAGGPTEGACLALFGVAADEVVRVAPLRQCLVQAAIHAVRRPTIAAVVPNTTRETEQVPARPKFTVKVRNPRANATSGMLRIVVGDGLRGEAPVKLGPNATTAVVVTLGEVPADFRYTTFDWSVTLTTESGGDELDDHVDVERALLQALGHLVRTQRQFPDGRISHHYFGDAYGVRALFAYLDLVRRQPDRLQRNRDLWAATDVEALRAAGLRFVDMLIARQNEDGSVPMGYGEQSPVYNVADGGQIGLAMGQIAPLLDPARREACWQFCRKFAAWAETFYIDDELAQELSVDAAPSKAAQARAGHYGLGSSRGVRNPYGPSWVLPDILGLQVLLTYVDPSPDYRYIADRNIRAYLDAGYAATGYFHAEAMTWAWRDARDAAVRQKIRQLLEQTFIPPLVQGKEYDMYELGARGSLRALPLIYCRRWITDQAGLRAALLKYTWAFASESSELSMRRLAEAHPKPQHGESLAASKFASFNAVWAMEMLEPGSTFLRWPGFPRAP